MNIVITGANRGIGAAMATLYRADRHTVIGTSRDATCDAELDVTRQDQQAALALDLKDWPVDLLICNAGVFLDKGEQLETGYAPDLWAKTFAANVTGVFLTIQSLLPSLRLSSAPKIAIISSQMASDTHAPGGSYIYRASKAAALNLGRNLAADLKPQGMAVGIYHPGWVQTDMGGSSADITEDQSAKGLIQRFNALTLETTGCFETWDGRAHPF